MPNFFSSPRILTYPQAFSLASLTTSSRVSFRVLGCLRGYCDYSKPGSNAYRIKKIVSVKELIDEFSAEAEVYLNK